MIDKIVYINLDRRTDRREWMEQTFSEKGVPNDIIHRFPAMIDCKDSDLTYDDVCRKIIDADLPPPYFGDPDYRTAGLAACAYSNVTMLERIANGTETVCVLEDDINFRYDWETTMSVLDFLNQRVSRIDIVQLVWTYNHKPYELMSKSLPGWTDGVVNPGQWAVIYTPVGAARTLEMCQWRWDLHHDSTIEASLFGIQGGIYGTIANDLMFQMPNADSELTNEVLRKKRKA